MHIIIDLNCIKKCEHRGTPKVKTLFIEDATEHKVFPFTHIFAICFPASVWPHCGPPANIKLEGVRQWAAVNSPHTVGKSLGHLFGGNVGFNLKNTFADRRSFLGSEIISEIASSETSIFP